MHDRESIRIWESTPDDFANINLLADNYPPFNFTIDQEYGKKVLNDCELCLTFSLECGILGIVGTVLTEHGVELFSCLGQPLSMRKSPNDLRYMRKVVDLLLDGREAFMSVYGVRSKKFAKFLGFNPTGCVMNGIEEFRRCTAEQDIKHLTLDNTNKR